MTHHSSFKKKRMEPSEQRSLKDEEERGEGLGDIKSWFPLVLVPWCLQFFLKAEKRSGKTEGTFSWFHLVD